MVFLLCVLPTCYVTDYTELKKGNMALLEEVILMGGLPESLNCRANIVFGQMGTFGKDGFKLKDTGASSQQRVKRMRFENSHFHFEERAVVWRPVSPVRSPASPAP